MKRITLLRHAKSSWAGQNMLDIERPLNERGRRNAPAMGARLKDLNCTPDFVLCSSAIRTQETAALFLPALGAPLAADDIRLEPRIYEASINNLLDAIADVPGEKQHVLVIGHNPGLELLSEALSPRSVSHMPTAAAASFDIDTPEWDHLVDMPTTLVFHDYPKKT